MRLTKLIAIAICLGLHVVSPFDAVAAEYSVRRPPKEVLAFYYGWYGNPQTSKQWVHWSGKNSSSQTIENITDYPTDGAYDSHDAAEVMAQTKAATAAGITGLISSWWGKGDFTDRSLSMLLDAAQQTHIHVSAYIERLDVHNNVLAEAARVTQVEYLVRQYGSHPAWLKVNGRPVFFIFQNAYKPGAVEVSKLLNTVRADLHPTPIFIGDVSVGADLDPHTFATSMDGIHGYNVRGLRSGMSIDAEMSVVRSNYAKWKLLSNTNQIFCLTVTPGADDSHLSDRPKPRPITPRQGGMLYTQMWRQAINENPDWILITSWNEWHEGTEIENSIQYKDLYLRLTKKFAEKFLQSTPTVDLKRR